MKRIVLTCMLFCFSILPLQANSGIYLYQNQDTLAETFDTLYNGDKKTIYSFAYKTNNHPFDLEANFYIDEELIYYNKLNRAVSAGHGNYYLSLFGDEIIAECDHPKNSHNTLSTVKHLKKELLDPKVMEHITYIRKDTKPLKSEKNLLMRGEAEINGQHHLMEIYVCPSKE